jgi:hypothetical protein
LIKVLSQADPSDLKAEAKDQADELKKVLNQGRKTGKGKDTKLLKIRSQLMRALQMAKEELDALESQIKAKGDRLEEMSRDLPPQSKGLQGMVDTLNQLSIRYEDIASRLPLIQDELKQVNDQLKGKRFQPTLEPIRETPSSLARDLAARISQGKGKRGGATYQDNQGRFRYAPTLPERVYRTIAPTNKDLQDLRWQVKHAMKLYDQGNIDVPQTISMVPLLRIMSNDIDSYLGNQVDEGHRYAEEWSTNRYLRLQFPKIAKYIEDLMKEYKNANPKASKTEQFEEGVLKVVPPPVASRTAQQLSLSATV